MKTLKLGYRTPNDIPRTVVITPTVTYLLGRLCIGTSHSTNSSGPLTVSARRPDDNPSIDYPHPIATISQPWMTCAYDTYLAMDPK